MILNIRVCDRDEPDYRAEADLVRFTLDGVEYEIDLCSVHKAAWQAMSDGWAAAGRRAGHVLRRTAYRPQAARRRSAATRAWAQVNGWPDLGPRGRIPEEAIAAYDAAHGQQAA